MKTKPSPQRTKYPPGLSPDEISKAMQSGMNAGMDAHNAAEAALKGKEPRSTDEMLEEVGYDDSAMG
mgnify:FL=1